MQVITLQTKVPLKHKVVLNLIDEGFIEVNVLQLFQVSRDNFKLGETVHLCQSTTLEWWKHRQ